MNTSLSLNYHHGEVSEDFYQIIQYLAPALTQKLLPKRDNECMIYLQRTRHRHVLFSPSGCSCPL